MPAQTAQLSTAADRRSNGCHRVSLVYNVASNPNPNPSSLLSQSPCSPHATGSPSLRSASPILLPQIRRPCSHSPPLIHLQLPTSSPSPAPRPRRLRVTAPRESSLSPPPFRPASRRAQQHPPATLSGISLRHRSPQDFLVCRDVGAAPLQDPAVSAPRRPAPLPLNTTDSLSLSVCFGFGDARVLISEL
jgi:hypothetical protein